MSSVILGLGGFRAEPALIWTQSQCTAVCVWADVVFMCLASFIMLPGRIVLQHMKSSDLMLRCAQKNDATEVTFCPVKTIQCMFCNNGMFFQCTLLTGYLQYISGKMWAILEKETVDQTFPFQTWSDVPFLSN